MIYRFIDAEKANFPIRIMCRVLDVPQSSYFDWNHHGRQLAEIRAAADAVIVAEIWAVHAESDATYGARENPGPVMQTGPTGRASSGRRADGRTPYLRGLWP